jgi:hypothetical protein
MKLSAINRTTRKQLREMFVNVLIGTWGELLTKDNKFLVGVHHQPKQ